jgi:hypothetical protein
VRGADFFAQRWAAEESERRCSAGSSGAIRPSGHEGVAVRCRRPDRASVLSRERLYDRLGDRTSVLVGVFVAECEAAAVELKA